MNKKMTGYRANFFTAATRVSYVSIVAAATSYIAFLMPTNGRVILRKLHWINRTGANGFLRVGYLTNAAIPVFTQVLPDILVLNGIDGMLNGDELPMCGNTPAGFEAETTANVGTTGDIVLQASVGAAAPTDLIVAGEVEVIMP